MTLHDDLSGATTRVDISPPAGRLDPMRVSVAPMMDWMVRPTKVLS